ncbi:hypothetical protein PI125_g19176 [Phytophthora idaei]|nr:hypothetical protein PI125_g19176 [Phytophthora idaei]KAG3137123.1 hypothetical protein PI126_g17527 [Phytophthora idaei]
MAQPGTNTQGPGPPAVGPLTSDTQKQTTEQDTTTSAEPCLEGYQPPPQAKPKGQGRTRLLGNNSETDRMKNELNAAHLSTLHTLAQPTSTWGDTVRAHMPQQSRITEETARKSRMLQGVWNPVQMKQLLATLMSDWEELAKDTWAGEDAKMRAEAMEPATACCDKSIMAWTPREHNILLKYLNGELELPHPPNFIKAILVVNIEL